MPGIVKSYTLSWAEETTNAISNLFSSNVFHPWFLRILYNILIISYTLSLIKGNLILFLSKSKVQIHKLLDSELIFKR